MIINDDILRQETVLLIRQIDAQINEVKKKAEEMGAKVEELRNQDGWVMPPLLLAKATAYNTLVQLQKK